MFLKSMSFQGLKTCFQMVFSVFILLVTTFDISTKCGVFIFRFLVFIVFNFFSLFSLAVCTVALCNTCHTLQQPQSHFVIPVALCNNLNHTL